MYAVFETCREWGYPVLNQDRLQYYRQRLDDERAREQEMLGRLEEGLRGAGQRDALAELSVCDNHPADIGTETFERSKDIGLRGRGQAQLAKIDEALARVAGGTYGICRRCGASIPEERLDVAPESVCCVKCQEMEEDRDRDSIRPVEEQVISMPFGRIPGDEGSTDSEYDGEDSWGDVARYGSSSDTVRHSEDRHLHDQDGDVEKIPYRRDRDGVFYQDLRGRDDDGPPAAEV
jgi:YteA family regulatory protein